MGFEFVVILIFATMLLWFALGAPVGISLGGIAMAVGYLSWGPNVFKLIAPTMINSISSFLLLAIPLFIFMGQVLVRSGLGEAMFNAAYVLAGRIAGGLAIGVVVVCALIGAMVGIIGAGIMTAGALALPPMLARGYDRVLALGTIMAGGGLGILIPPSIPMILYAAMTKVSLGQMFAASLLPAALMVTAFIAYIGIRCAICPKDGPPIPIAEAGELRDKVRAVGNGMVALVLIVVVLGSILFGIATPTEAGGIGALGACLVALLYRRFGPRDLWEGSVETARLTSMCMWILIGATVLSNFNLLMGAGNLVKEGFFALGLGPWGTIIAMQVVMMVMGTILDEYVIVLICAPLFTPIVVGLGFDPLWFGILMILNLEIAIQTPPYGFALFYLKGVAPKDVTMLEIYRAVVPFVLIKVGVLGVCMAFPAIVMWLPTVIFR